MADAPTVARFIVASPSSPKLTYALVLAERIHLALVQLSNGSSVFTGCDSSHKPLHGHRHAHIFCECNEEPGSSSCGEITHVTVYASSGFGRDDLQALQCLKEVWGSDDPAIRLQLLDLGQPEDFESSSPLLAESRVWVSRTPFVPVRHPKVTRAGVPKVDASGLQIGSPEHELVRLLGLAGFPEPVAVERVAGTILGGREVAWREFVCRRNEGKGRRAAYDRGYGFRIEFAEDVRGPVAAGYGEHFGMGGFVGDKPKCIYLRENLIDME